ncbi:sensor N-terminal transmembrane domain-containing protein [Pacificimonas sp. WHA3]|uniref:histidine kinase n=2 Tax=Pacificimonas pallii TaxID=2827236 RepID=A0ABS6SHB9_9SPHN|nr:ATP-binding protein [Pacificimonas pallii]MBV7257433.1 sensor N-terminal transmembrane domain-containing protein [Pacificimonas pallii]
MAVNLFAVLMLAGGVLYLDGFRERLLEQRETEVRVSAALLAASVSDADGDALARQLAAAARIASFRVRVYGPDGRLQVDNWDLAGPTYTLIDPETQPLRKDVARLLDRSIEALAGARRLDDMNLDAPDVASSHAVIAMARAEGRPAATLLYAPDRTPVAFAAAALPEGRTLMLSANARDITRIVRSERAAMFLIFLGVVALSMLLSSFLARTIVRPLRRLAIAAQRVRLGRSREVTVPRFQLRRDEIGELSRSLSDMTGALRSRIDATEAFAADVAHELKNPLASLRSAIEGLERVEDPDLRAQLLKIVKADIDRLDRLISDISDASRLDAELSRARFERVDLGAMLEAVVTLYEERGLPRNIELALARPGQGTTCILADERRLAQVVRNLIDNAISFSPDGGIVQVGAARGGGDVIFYVEDAGPGIPPGTEEKIFKRFYSERPQSEDFGRHSGLGLAISRAIVEAHDGTIAAHTRAEGGARFVATLPAA